MTMASAMTALSTSQALRALIREHDRHHMNVA
jgi:hypothetical protein